jgi:hypothetical protein
VGSSFGQSWAAEETSAPWLSPWPELVDVSDPAGLDESVSEEFVSEALVSLEFEVPVSDEFVLSDDVFVEVVKGEPATAKAAPPMSSTVMQAMTTANGFFMPR